VRRTGDIGLFKVVSEGAVAAGVRRIEALTGEAAREHLLGEEALLKEMASTLKTAPAELPARLNALLEDRRRLERELAEARQALVSGGGGAAQTKQIGSVTVMAKRLDGVPASNLRTMVDGMKKELGSGIAALVSVTDGKVALAVGVTEDLTKRLNAVDLVRAGAAAVGGKGGGGRPDMAQAGGPDTGQADRALAAIEEALGG